MTTAMVVDDAPDVRRLLDLVFSMAGFGVVQASSGVDAVRMLRGDPLPDVVILDVQMPDLDGWETLERLRADPRTTQTPVILCTVKGMAQDNLRAWTLGCDGFVTKPVNIGDLVDQVRRVLSLSAEERATERVRRLRQLSGATG